MNTKKLPLIGLYTFYGLLAYMPLHILLSTWVGTSFDILPFMKVAKDVVLVAGFLATLAASVKQPWFKELLYSKLVWLILAYSGLTLLLAAVKPTDQDAEVLGVVYNTRFLLFFLYGLLLARLYNPTNLLNQAVKIVLGVGTIVIVFGVIQYTLLPDDALTRLGYSRENGVLPAFFIDDKPDLERVMSTVRDPNSLGSYLLILTPLALLAWPFNRKRFNFSFAIFHLPFFKKQSRLPAAIKTPTANNQPPINNNNFLPSALCFPITIYQLLITLCLFFTFSRSAWLGFVVVIGFLLVFYSKRVRVGKKWLALSCASLLLITASLFLVRDSYFVQNVVFHADESTVLEDPNELRLKFLQESVQDIAENPVGSGPGTAGLASIRNNQQGTILNENYYLQIATEVGLLGLALFLSILVVVGNKLWRLRANPVALVLLASFVGLAFTNLFVHIWSNEAVAYTWWGLAGLAVYGLENSKITKMNIKKLKKDLFHFLCQQKQTYFSLQWQK